jgi:hypothetical protein
MFDERVTADVDVVLDRVCRELANGGDHNSRERIAEILIQAAKNGSTTLGELEAVARRAMLELKNRSSS